MFKTSVSLLPEHASYRRHSDRSVTTHQLSKTTDHI